MTIVDRARAESRVILTADFDFADIVRYPPENLSGVVVLALLPADTREIILALVRRFLMDGEIVAHLERRLVIVERHRVRIRPPIAPK